jgi:hypothetical protein
MNRAPSPHRRAAALCGLFTFALLATARADELFVASPTTLITQGNPYTGSFATIGLCGGQAQSMTLNGSQLLIGDPNGHVYKKSPSDSFVSYAFDVPNDAQALAMHAGNLLSGGSNSTIARVDATTGALIGTLTTPLPVSAMAIVGDDVYAGSPFGVVHKGNALTGNFQFFGTCGGPVNSIVVDSTHMIIGSSDGRVYRINLSTQNVDAQFTISNDAAAMVMQAGDLLIGGSNSTVLRVQRFTGFVKGTIAANAPVSAMALEIGADPGSAYCYGSACPCGNDDPLAGCANTTGFGGRLAASGSTSVAADDIEIFAFQIPANHNGRFYMSQITAQVPFGDGFVCAGGGGYPSFRFPLATSGPAGAFMTPEHLIAFCNTHFVASGHIAPGATWHFQVWYRDPSGPCGSNFNTTNSTSVVFEP